MKLKSGFLTSEFWTMVASLLGGIGVASGIVEPAAKDTLVASIQTVVNGIVGGAMVIIPAYKFIAGRTWLKTKTADELKKN